MLNYVDATRLYFRSEPVLARTNRIGTLHLGQGVEVRGAGSGGFVEVTTEIEGAEMDGFVAERYLREPQSAEREALVQQAISQWKRFNFGLGKEHNAPFFEFVGEMWQSIGLNLNGRDRDTPWASAAISFMVRNAGEALPSGSNYPKFRFAAADFRYVMDAIEKRKAGDTEAPFWGFDLHEVRPRLGDIVSFHREGGDFDFDEASRLGVFKSHSDIIVRISEEEDLVYAIGGNIGHSVKVVKYELTPEGFLDNKKRVFAILVNQHD